MEYKELKNKNISELKSYLSEQRELLRDLRFKDSNKQLKNVRQLRMIKKTIAKILTAINKQDNENSK